MYLSFTIATLIIACLHLHTYKILQYYLSLIYHCNATVVLYMYL